MPAFAPSNNPLVWQGKRLLNMGDCVSAILAIKTSTECRQFYQIYLKNLLDTGLSQKNADIIIRSNIGWCFGEGMSPEKQAMWKKVTGAVHPVFGDKNPSPHEAFRMGMEMGGKK